MQGRTVPVTIEPLLSSVETIPVSSMGQRQKHRTTSVSSQLWHWLAVWPWANHFPSLDFSFFTSFLEMTKKSPFQSYQATTLMEEPKINSRGRVQGLKSKSPWNSIFRELRPSSSSSGEQQPQNHRGKSLQPWSSVRGRAPLLLVEQAMGWAFLSIQGRGLVPTGAPAHRHPSPGSGSSACSCLGAGCLTKEPLRVLVVKETGLTPVCHHPKPSIHLQKQKTRAAARAPSERLDGRVCKPPLGRDHSMRPETGWCQRCHTHTL